MPKAGCIGGIRDESSPVDPLAGPPISRPTAGRDHSMPAVSPCQERVFVRRHEEYGYDALTDVSAPLGPSFPCLARLDPDQGARTVCRDLGELPAGRGAQHPDGTVGGD